MPEKTSCLHSTSVIGREVAQMQGASKAATASVLQYVRIAALCSNAAGGLLLVQSLFDEGFLLLQLNYRRRQEDKQFISIILLGL